MRGAREAGFGSDYLNHICGERLKGNVNLATMNYRAVMICVLAAGTLTAGPKKPVKLKDHYAFVNGVKLHYVSAGKGDLMIFLHGFPEFWYEWRNQLAEFGKDHLAVAPDMRGYNLSDKPGDVDSYQTKYLIEDVRALGAAFGT